MSHKMLNVQYTHFMGHLTTPVYLLHSTSICVILSPGTSTHNSQQMLDKAQRKWESCPTRSACAKHLGN